MIVRYAPLGSFLIWLARGWRLARRPLCGHHGEYSVMLVRDEPGEV